MSAGHFRHFFEHYLAPHPAREVRELFMSRALRDFAVALVMVFEPIYLYREGFGVIAILAFYAVLYALFFFLLPLGYRIARQRGYEKTMALSTPFLILYYLAFFGIAWDWRFIFLALAALAIEKMLYWPAYHSDFALWHKGSESGREVAGMAAILSLTGALAPLIGGAVIALGGFTSLFLLVAVILVISNIPMLLTPERVEPEPVPYWPAVRRVFKHQNRRHFWAFMGFGEELIALVLWPVFIGIAVPDLLSLGAIITLAMAVKLAITLYVGGLVDEGARMPVLRNGVVFSAASWLIRPLANGPLGVFLFDSFYRVSVNMTIVPITAITYDNALDKGGTEYIVFFEMVLSLAKIAACLLGMLVFWLVPDGWWIIFLIAGAFTVLYTLIPEDANDFAM
jgi:hypothetical protein